MVSRSITRVQDADDVLAPVAGGLLYYDGTKYAAGAGAVTDGANLTISGIATLGTYVSPSGPSPLNLTLDSLGAGRFRGTYDEDTTFPAAYVGYADGPRMLFANGIAAQNWQIDNSIGRFRWFTPGIEQMVLTPYQSAGVSGSLDLCQSKPILNCSYIEFTDHVRAPTYLSADGTQGASNLAGLRFKSGLFVGGLSNAAPLDGQVLAYSSSTGIYAPTYPSGADRASLIVAGSGPATYVQGGFGTILCDGGQGYYDPGGNYNMALGIYTVPVAGLYQIDANIRLADGAAAMSYGHGVHTSNADGAQFSWYQTNTTVGSGTSRNGAPYRRVAFFNAGDQLRHYGYGDQTVSVDTRSMAIVLLKAS